jgi:penicillin-binding protein 1A
MRLLSKTVTAIFLTIISTSSVTAQDSEQKLPSLDQIRQLYRESSANWDTIPVVALQAFVGAEDRRFYERPVGISTITQQIGKWYLLPGAGRLHQLALALLIGEELSHEEDLDWYVNQVFLGQTCFGVSGAATAYFGIAVDDLNLEQAAYLAALPKAPMAFNPVKSYDRAVERRNFVLKEMQKSGFISADEAKHAIQSDLTVVEPLGRCKRDQ